MQVKKKLDESDGGVLCSLLSMPARVSAPTNMQNHWRGKSNFGLVHFLRDERKSQSNNKEQDRPHLGNSKVSRNRY